METNQISSSSTLKFSLFTNQTSGHSCMIKIANNLDNYILKPLDFCEQKFYEMMQNKKLNNFSNFIPKYFGVYQPTFYEIEYFGELARKFIEQDENLESPKMKKNSKIHKSFLKKLYLERFNPKTYIKLEDLTNGKNPRILDLKLGYTAYNEKKIYTQSKKYKESTCNSEGFRFAGLKNYLRSREELLFRDKYWGFSLKTTDLIHAFALFFYDGEIIQKKVLKQFLRKIDDLIESLNEMRGYVFHSSSLLMIYDDKSCENDDYNDLHIKLIDFANVLYYENKANDVDESLINSLKNIQNYLKILNETQNIAINLNL